MYFILFETLQNNAFKTMLVNTTIYRQKMTTHKHLSKESVNINPIVQFGIWYQEHCSIGVPIPEAVSLGTSAADGNVSVRTVLLKEFGEAGFVFFTNYNSKKGSQLSQNPKAALLFYWSESGRQVRIEGNVEKVSAEYSDSYFKTRPRESQLSAWASQQSSTVPDRQHLETRYEYYVKDFTGKSVERPPQWGGFRLIPSWFEFWQNDERRLHDRLTYTKVNSNWKIERLAP